MKYISALMKRVIDNLPVMLIGILFVCLLWYGLGIVAGPPDSWLYRFQQQRLARQWNVNVDSYPVTWYFPIGYFQATLRPGMKIEQVHSVVRDYAKVLQCGEREVYYYFSSTDPFALRFEVDYDLSSAGQYDFAGLILEERDSNPLHIDGCKDGPISP